MDNIDVIQILTYLRNSLEQSDGIADERNLGQLFTDIDCTSFVTALNHAIDAVHTNNERGEVYEDYIRKSAYED